MLFKLFLASIVTLTIFGYVFHMLNKKRNDNTNILRDIAIATSSGIVSGAVVLIFSLPLGTSYNNDLHDKFVDENLNSIRLGISRDYCDQVFGAPMISRELPTDYYQVDKNGDGIFEKYSFATSGYKLKYCVLLCVFRDNSLDAFVIVTNNERAYKVKPVSNTYLSGRDKYLLDFTYSDFSENVNWDLCKAYDSNEDAFYYYSEMVGGAHVDDYIYYMVGNYDVGYDGSAYLSNLYELVRYGNMGMVPPEYEQNIYDSQELEEIRQTILNLRKLCKPNTYGEVNYTIYSQFNFTNDIIMDVTSYSLLFKD